MEEVSVGGLTFERDFDSDLGDVVSVYKTSDVEGWITFIRCPVDSIEWSAMRNLCYPLNGKLESPPVGQWIIHQYVGKDGSSADLHPDRSEKGFTNEEIKCISVVVNLMYADEGVTRRQLGIGPLGSNEKH